MTIQILTYGLGIGLLVLGILGGGFEIKEIKVPKLPAGVRIAAYVAGLIFIGFAVFQSYEQLNLEGAEAKMGDMELDTDRPGAAYFSFVFQTDSPSSCLEACRVDPLCKAWSLVKPNTTGGPEPVCNLKKTVSPPRQDSCCVSGTKGE